MLTLQVMQEVQTPALLMSLCSEMEEMDCQVVMAYLAGMVSLGLLEWQEKMETRDHLVLKVKGQVLTQIFS